MRTTVLALSLFVAACAAPAPVSPLPADPFFRMKLARPGPAPALAPPGEGAYRIDLHLLGGEAPWAPSLTLSEGQAGSVFVADPTSFIQDFDIEVGEDSFIADPVIGVAQSGLRVDACPVRLPGTSEVALSWHVVQSAVGRPIRRRTAKIAAEFPPVVFQLPCTGVSEATGRTRVAPRVETLLARLPAADGGPDLALTARVTPVASSRREESAAGGAGGSPPGAGNGDDADRLSLPDLLARARELPPPKGAVRYEIRVLRVDRPVPGPVHLDRAAAEETLAALSARTLRRFVLNAAAEAGLEARSADLLAGHRATKTVRVPGSDRRVGDPQIGTTEVGFAAAFALRDGQPGVDWRLSTIRSVRDEGEREVPETDTREGFLPLGGDASLSPISPLEGGGALALLVRRVP